MADQGLGFLSGALFCSAPQSQINEADGATEGDDENTVGAPGMGKVINGLDSSSEKALFKELRAAYWFENGVRHFVAIGVIISGLVLSTLYAELPSLMYALLTLIVTVTYLKGH